MTLSYAQPVTSHLSALVKEVYLVAKRQALEEVLGEAGKVREELFQGSPAQLN